MSMTRPTSEQVTFLASGSGAVQRTALDKFRETRSAGDYGYSLSGAVTGIGSTVCELVIDAGLTVSSNLTVPANISLRVIPGAVIVVANAVTLQIAGPFDAGLAKCFELTGTGAIQFTQGQVVLPEWFGTDGINDAVAIQKAVNSLVAPRGGTVYFQPGTKYVMGSTVTIDTSYKPVHLVSGMADAEAGVGGHFQPAAALSNGIFHYKATGPQLPRGSNVSGLSFYDITRSAGGYAIGAAINFEDWTGKCDKCIFEWLNGPAIKTDYVIMSSLLNIKVRLCGGLAPDNFAIRIGDPASAGNRVTQSMVIDNLISEVNFHGPYLSLTSKARDVKITNAQFEAATVEPGLELTNQNFIYNNGLRIQLDNSQFSRNLETQLLGDTALQISNCIFVANQSNGNPKVWIKGQGLTMNNCGFGSGLTHDGYDLVVGNPAVTNQPTYATLSNLNFSYGGGLWEAGRSVLSNISMVRTYELTSPPTGKYALVLGAHPGFGSQLTNLFVSLLQAGNFPLSSPNSSSVIVNATGFQVNSSVTISNPATTAVVTHGLGFTPTISQIQLTSSANLGAMWVTSITSTQFTINVASSPASSAAVGFRVRW
jgi:hypothetical protein